MGRQRNRGGSDEAGFRFLIEVIIAIVGVVCTIGAYKLGKQSLKTQVRIDLREGYLKAIGLIPVKYINDPDIEPPTDPKERDALKQYWGHVQLEWLTTTQSSSALLSIWEDDLKEKIGRSLEKNAFRSILEDYAPRSFMQYHSGRDFMNELNRIYFHRSKGENLDVEGIDRIERE